MSDRRGLGAAIAESRTISESEDGSFSVPSQTREGVFYSVKALGDEWVCSCPDFENRADKIEACKHIIGVKLWIAARVELQNKPKPKAFADDAVQCAKCGSIRVVKNGIKRHKQAYICRDCGHRFTEQSLLKGSRYTPEMVSLTLDLYFSGTSLRKTARILNNHFGLKLGNATVYRWIQKFVPRISEYVGSLAPQLSEIWHADEVFINMKGGREYKTKTGTKVNIAYLWNVMDRETRFLLASRLSKFRDIQGADFAFQQAAKNAHGSNPERVYTDSLHSYETALKVWPYGKKPLHIANAGVNKPHKNNNRIERLNGTVRERTKVQRGWKTMKTPLAEGQRIHYNFVKPHAALEGQTPAEVAGVGIQGENKWLELLRASLIPQGEAQA